MKGEFNHVCGTARAARSLPRARSSLAYGRRRQPERFSDAATRRQYRGVYRCRPCGVRRAEHAAPAAARHAQR
ncbi:hypothetical protein DB771_06850 [Burkholderia sp. AU29985]|nr:hypothetical protein EGY28_28060 [Burkholderia dolosa]PRE55841.1 hypothetical protein C6P87_03895 [Burkholderia sp. AU12872]PUA77610.1 hypothetical protein DB771_06850 [Burkholderia sp. AU29985]